MRLGRSDLDLYYNYITIVNYDSKFVNKFGASLTDDARVVIYDHCMFMVKATGVASVNYDRKFIICKAPLVPVLLAFYCRNFGSAVVS
jgi:hypothetical protein